MSKAFTLIELLVVILLMGIIFGISVPMFSGMGRGAEMNGVVRSLSSTISLTRQWAITKKETAGVIVDAHTFFAVSMDQGSSTVSGSDIQGGRVNVEGKLVGENIIWDQGTDHERADTLYGRIVKDGGIFYFINLNGNKSPILAHNNFMVYNNISDPVAFDGVILKMKSNGSEVNGLTFRTTGGLKDEKDYTIEIRDVRKPDDPPVKTITVGWLTGGVRVGN